MKGNKTMNNTRTTPGKIMPGYLRKQQAAEYLGISRRTLSNLMRAGKIPFSRLTGRLVLFNTNRLDMAVNGFEIRTGKGANHDAQ
jgi:excisionase family DNA binding protein